MRPIKFDDIDNFNDNETPLIEHMKKAVRYYRMGNRDEAHFEFVSAAYCVYAINQPKFLSESQEPIAYVTRGVIYHEVGRYRDAIACFSAAIYMEPDKASYYNKRGLSYAELEEYTYAIDDFTWALNINPDYELAHRNLDRTREWSENKIKEEIPLSNISFFKMEKEDAMENETPTDNENPELENILQNLSQLCLK